MKAISQKKPKKDEREKAVLLGLVQLYLTSGKPIGSNTLRENGFDDLSSATIRNYFAKLEETGYLKQQHSSGGRIPTEQAYKLYAETYLHSPLLEEKEKRALQKNLSQENREVASYLQHVAEIVSTWCSGAVFLSAPRFDQDFVRDLKLVKIDPLRCLCILITDFGLVHTEILHTEKKLSQFSIKRIESYFHYSVTGFDKPSLSSEEEALAKKLYKEVMLRHIVRYSNFPMEDIYKTGFSKLLSYPDFNDATALANGLSLFENQDHLRKILRDCAEEGSIKTWIGNDLYPLSESASFCSVVAVPYKIGQTIVGSIAILGPSRLPYRRVFGILQTVSETLSESLTKSMYKFKISYRKPKPSSMELNHTGSVFVDQTQCLLLENKTHNPNLS